MKVPATTRVYAIGDIHGRHDLLQKLLKGIAKDAEAHSQQRHHLVTLGDYIDRGPDSRKVIDTLINLSWDSFTVRYLKGNHEAMLFEFLKDPTEEGLFWLSNGGWATLISYGFRVGQLPESMDDFVAVRDQVVKSIPEQHWDFLKSLQLSYQLGDYFFTHAGVRPNVDLDKQEEQDMLWIRSEFLTSKKDFGKIVVHGHSAVNKPQIFNNRIALDTGAFYSGKLSCLVLSGEERYFLQADENERLVVAMGDEP